MQSFVFPEKLRCSDTSVALLSLYCARRCASTSPSRAYDGYNTRSGVVRGNERTLTGETWSELRLQLTIHQTFASPMESISSMSAAPNCHNAPCRITHRLVFLLGEQYACTEQTPRTPEKDLIAAHFNVIICNCALLFGVCTATVCIFRLGK